jgi:hypothetical protein
MIIRNMDLQKLLNEFIKLPKIEASLPTFTEIAGFPHFENVCSNILAYYFDSSQRHGLRDLLLKSLFECVPAELKVDVFDTLEIRREELTTCNKRIDLIIETEDAVVAIENKIYAGLYNDLEAYSRYIKRQYYNKTKQVQIVLSLKNISPEKMAHGFINITYDQFITRIRYNLGDYLLLGDSKSNIFLLDFLQSILNLTKSDPMNKDILDFFNDNKEAIQNLFEERIKLQQFVAQKVTQLKSLIISDSPNVNQWIYKKHDLVHDFNLDGIIVAVDCVFDFDGIEIMVWIRKGNVNSYEYLKKLAIFQNVEHAKKIMVNNRIILITKDMLPLLTPIETIAAALTKILSEIKIVTKKI